MVEKKTLFVNTHKNVFLCQNIDEDEQDYLVKVKRLAGDSDLSTTEQVSNLRNVNLQRESMAKRLDQTDFARILKTSTVAGQAVQFFDGDTECTVSIKKTWVQQVTILKSSSNAASNCCNNSSSQFINYMSEAEYHARGRRPDGSHKRTGVCRCSCCVACKLYLLQLRAYMNLICLLLSILFHTPVLTT